MASFRKRLLLVHLAVILAIVACTALAGYWGLSRAVHGQLDAALLALGETEMAMLPAAPRQPVSVHEVAPGLAPPSLMRLDRLVQIIDGEGRVLARSRNLEAARLPAPPALLARLAAGETVFETLPKFGEEPLRMVSMPVPSSGARLSVQVAGSLDDANHVLASATLLFGAMALALLAAVGLAGEMLTRRVLGAIDDVVLQARSIGEASLHQRLPHPGTPDEIGRLVDTLNAMLDRLEHGYDAQRRFTADASHELRSPLSRLRTEIEITLRRPRESPEYVDALASCLDEVQRLTTLVEELLMLTRLDAGQERNAVESVHLNPLLRAAAQRLEKAAAQRGIRLALDDGAPVHARVAAGPVDLVLANLLDNAVKFSPPDSVITLQVSRDGGDVLVSVADAGPGIGVEDLPHLFERFYRGAQARAGEAPGFGLGLALSQAIVHAYGGRIEAQNRAGGGALFTMRLPASG
ncbi:MULTISPECIES: sensor histidine kinase [unclassified Janthinobacterium]|uniref:sensor histidine kinase n=1 Tax=unclassified Janthinobacterium TaxID=2610881 RepID=UPI0008F4B8CE|nr:MULTISPECIES: ATP-binding protein [unclassified Janthinobacterium]APA66961.1 histidine kinase [Janthinobacterium sp. 1_2014MBL_MicDiv]MDN2708376.1 ATP-binding protein [Janthinobacterium sp. SUN118]